MVRKAQIRFICVSLSLLLVVFALIEFGAYIISKNSCRSSINDRLNRLETNFSFIISPATGSATKTNEGYIVLRLANNSYTTFDTDKNITSEDAEEIISKAFSRYPSVTSSYYGHVYYRITKLNDADLLVMADMSDYLERATKNTLKALFPLIVLYAILALIVWAFSYMVFQPIKEALYKHKKFISDASHELKTPIAVISANADVLKTKIEGDKYLDSIKSQTKRMGALVSDMLTLAKMDETNIKPIKETFNLSDVVTETILPFDAVAFENGKTLLSEIENNVNYTGDRGCLKQIINILMDNAIKYSSAGGTIKVTLSGQKIVISNSGSNIKEEDSNRIFERFFRGDNSRSRDTGGSGLGLSIAKGIANANKWTIRAKSIFGVSMTITLEL